MAIVLDSGPLGRVTHPRATDANLRCREWLERLLLAGESIAIPEICWYEVRRELVRAGSTTGLDRLDRFCMSPAMIYLPVTTSVLEQASQLWADARNRGQPTSADAALDIDVILAAQALDWSVSSGESVTIATTNVKHLDQFVAARDWEQWPTS
jgi:predicted nucleic acid-binding protein